MEKFDILFSKKAKSEPAKEAPMGATPELVDLLDNTEKRELLDKRETELSVLTSVRMQMETELELAKKSGDFTEFNKLNASARKVISAVSSLQRKYERETSPADIIASYNYVDESAKESLREISFNFEKVLEFNQDFYDKHGVELPSNFDEIMADIWERNREEIFEQIEEKGFDKMIFIPESVDQIDLKLLGAKMTDGYEKEKGNKTYWGADASEIKSSRSGHRMLLLHQADNLTSHPELWKTLGKKYGGDKIDGEDNKAEDFVKSGESMTIQEWLVFQRQIQIEKGVHVDGKLTPDASYIYATWLPGSSAGSRVVYAFWVPDGALVWVVSLAPDNSGSALGCRLSRCFQ